MPLLLMRRPALGRVLIIVLGLLVSVWLASHWAQQRYWGELATETRGQLELYAQSLHMLVERFRTLPAVFALDTDIQALMQHSDQPTIREQLSQRLQQLNETAEVQGVLYLLNLQGQTIAVSNRQRADSFIGGNYAFRPYFQEALSQGHARYFAVGVTVGIPGYFLSQALYASDGHLLGVLVLKLYMESLQHDWANQPGVLLISDQNAVVILTNRVLWRFRQLQLQNTPARPLPDLHRYGYCEVAPLWLQPLHPAPEGSELLRINGPEGRRDYLSQSQQLSNEGWTLQVLREAQTPVSLTLGYSVAAAGSWLTLVFLLLFLGQRQKNRLLLLRRRAELEQLVEERTAALRQTQDELVQAAKMAALGQMSAALVHEINQPLTAMRIQLSTLGLLLNRNDPNAIHTCISHLDDLLTRMAALTNHLKTFARDTPGGLCERLALDTLVAHALLVLEARLHQEAVQPHYQGNPQAWVKGNGIRLEQVLINLLDNALDATAGQAHRELRIELRQDQHDWLLSVIDNGSGIPSQYLAQVFEPFFTTKPVGAGLGLGLAVSYSIVRESGGHLEVCNLTQGVQFTLRLPAVAKPDA